MSPRNQLGVFMNAQNMECKNSGIVAVVMVTQSRLSERQPVENTIQKNPFV